MYSKDKRQTALTYLDVLLCKKKKVQKQNNCTLLFYNTKKSSQQGISVLITIVTIHLLLIDSNFEVVSITSYPLMTLMTLVALLVFMMETERLLLTLRCCLFTD